MHTGTFMNQERVETPAAVTPAEAARLNDTQDRAIFHAAVLKINERLKKEYRTGGRVEIGNGVVGSGKIGDEVLAHFRAAGWKCEYKTCPDPREPYSYYEFTE